MLTETKRYNGFTLSALKLGGQCKGRVLEGITCENGNHWGPRVQREYWTAAAFISLVVDRIQVTRYTH